MDVIFKEGMLYLQGFKFGKKIWRKIWMVLFKPSSSGVGRLEFLSVLDTNAGADQKKAARQRASARKVVRLSDCLSVTPAAEEPCPDGHTCFYLNTTQCIYALASVTSQDWISALCLLAFQKDPGESDKGLLERGNALTMEDNELYSSWKIDLTVPAKCYPVTVQSTEASRRCKLAGEYLVSTDKEAVMLRASKTCHIIYCWPHRLLRKFGLVEGGFRIEAGRRCDSGEGVFIFLSTHSHLIFQAILEQCSPERRPSVQTPSVNKRSLSDPSVVVLPTMHVRAAAPTVLGPADASDDTEETYYDSINNNHEAFAATNSKEAAGAEGEDEEEWCQSLEALKLEDDTEENIYYNLRRATPPIPKHQLSDGADSSECIYADVLKISPPVNLHLQPFPPLVPEQPTYAQSVCCSALQPRYQRQPPVNDYIQTEPGAQTQLPDDTQEMEEASARVGPTVVPGSFKHRLAEIISKDLAKFQPAPPSGPGSPAFTQY